jgi:uncharacterized protein (DUF2237 family)
LSRKMHPRPVPWARWLTTRCNCCMMPPSDRPCLCTARVAELVDALDLGSSGVTRGGSSPPSRTIPARLTTRAEVPARVRRRGSAQAGPIQVGLGAVTCRIGPLPCAHARGAPLSHASFINCSKPVYVLTMSGEFCLIECVNMVKEAQDALFCGAAGTTCGIFMLTGRSEKAIGRRAVLWMDFSCLRLAPEFNHAETGTDRGR